MGEAYDKKLQERIDWLALNVHEWPEQYVKAYVVHDEVVFIEAGRPDPKWLITVTRQQWLDRRAELQNKPSWKDAGPWANWLSQSEDGEWWFSLEKPECDGNNWRFNSSAAGNSKWNGEVLGDWRDTLEKRPYISVTNCKVSSSSSSSSGAFGVTAGGPSEQAVTARLQEATDNVLAAVPELKSDKYKFEPFTSVEDPEDMFERLYWEFDAEKAKNTATTRDIFKRKLRAVWYEKSPATHTIHHAAFLHQGCQLLLNEPELVVFRTADGELIHCKHKECLIDPDVCGLAARLLADMSGHPVAPEHMRELVEQMRWHV